MAPERTPPERALDEGRAAARRRSPDAAPALDGRIPLLALQRAAGNAAVSALMAARFRSSGAQAVADIDAALASKEKEIMQV